MSVLTAAAFLSKWTARFADNTTRDISEADMREFVEDIKDSFSNILGGTVITAWKDPCIVATTANITLSGEQTIDGVLTSASRVLVKAQTTTSQNGIYVSAAGAWSRATDADAASELEGAAVGVTQGTLYANTVWLQTTDSITLGSSAIQWQQIGFGVSSQNLTQVLTQGNDGGGLGIENIADPSSAQDAATKAYVDNRTSAASETTAGIAEIATQAETNTGTDDARFITPLKLKNVATSGTYTPTLTGVTNIASSVAYQCQYMKVGSVVTVSGRLGAQATATTTDTTLAISLPIASNFTTDRNASGVAYQSDANRNTGGAIRSDISSDKAEFIYRSESTSMRSFYFTFTYEIL